MPLVGTVPSAGTRWDVEYNTTYVREGFKGYN